MAETGCPNCGSTHMHRSRRRHAIEWILAETGAGMCRCHDCNARYARVGSSLIRLRDVRMMSKPVCWALAMAAAVFIILLAISWVGRRETSPNPDTGSAGVLLVQG